MADLLKSPKAEMLAVYGRRRVGKTFLIKTVYQANLCFDFTGTQNATMTNQLFKFYEKLKESFPTYPFPDKINSWQEAFQILKKCLIATEITAQKRVVFLDELPWLASARSNFLEELGYWWNDWASQQNLIVVLCGSAASWMLKKVIHHTGGLHNRVTKKINLKPFTLSETRMFLESINVVWDDYQIIQFYMAVGGIPTYLQEAQQGETVTQTINRVLFSKDGALSNEFTNLYAALFDNHQNHILIIKILAEKWSGMSRKEIIHKSGLKDGGGLTKILEELEASSFITQIPAFQKKHKDFVYRLSDEYSLFYLKFMEGRVFSAKNEWQKASGENKYKIWSGYAFESICIKHVEAIKIALGISGIYTETSSFFHKGNDTTEGLQIDLVIDRADRAINLCEIKFYNDDFVMTDALATTLRQRRQRFKELANTRKVIFNTIVTTYGIKHSRESLGQIDNVITMDKLFVLKSFE